MHYTPPVFGLRVVCSYDLPDPAKSVCTDDKYVFTPRFFRLLSTGNRYLEALVLPALYGDDLFLTLGIDPWHYIRCKLPDDTVFSYGVVYSVYEDQRIYII